MKMLLVSALVCAMVVLTRAAAPPEETPQDETAPPEETPQDETAPPEETPQDETAPPEETPQNETAPPEETPQNETAPPEETPQDETESRLVKRWFLRKPSFKLKPWFKPKPWCKPRPCFKPRPCVKPRPCFKSRLCIKPRPCPVLPRLFVFCPWGWSKYRGHCYRYIPRSMTWAKAEKNCQRLGGNLASVHNFREYQAIQNVIYRATRSKRPTWIGGSDAEEEHYWFWSDGTSFNYRRWCHGEPNNGGGAGQHCIQMNYSANKCWDDLQCSNKLPSVCVRKRR